MKLRTLIVLFVCLPALWPVGSTASEAPDPAEIQMGERLFLETRFAQFFFANGTGGDPALDTTETTAAPLPGPFAGESMNCRACHLVDEHLEATEGGMRSYGDFARRSPIPAREDGKTHTVRNSPPLVNASLPRFGGALFHFDGEFPTMPDLVKGTLTGRNYGWLPTEYDQAVSHIAEIIRNDDGSGDLAQEFGGPYRIVLAGTDPSLPEALRLPPEFRIDTETASDRQILDAVAKLIAAYVEDLTFEQDPTGQFVASPYDLFLAKNGLPRGPAEGESPQKYSRRLARHLAFLRKPIFVSPDEGEFAFHDQPFVFGEQELKGMRIFFREADPMGINFPPAIPGATGNCVACHTAPAFTDFGFHNTGATQREYDEHHGPGAFAQLKLPSLLVRNLQADMYLPANAANPDSAEIFLRVPDANRPGETDLGVWNMFANPTIPRPQVKLWTTLCRQSLREAIKMRESSPARPCSPSTLLNRSVAAFKTPGLRDLGHSAPYLHTGQFDSLEDVIEFYIDSAKLARTGDLVNAPAELADVDLAAENIPALTAFLRALNEDYE
ncbi:MAG: cytochrome c peroxidase [Pseudomonadota bacterium]|nr:cytochrome c peroxidase [Pseudomonadota bacterium]